MKNMQISLTFKKYKDFSKKTKNEYFGSKISDLNQSMPLSKVWRNLSYFIL